VTTKEVLLKAAEEIERRGWIQRVAANERGCCIWGAFRSIGYSYEGIAPVNLAYDVFEDYLGVHPVGWNDTPGRTKEEVLSALRAAAEAA
jgi:hypothetical protein